MYTIKKHGNFFIIAAATVFTLGCVVAYQTPPEVVPYVLCIVVGLTITALLTRKRKKVAIICLYGIILLLGVMRVLVPMNNEGVPLTEQYKEQVQIQGVIKGDIEDKTTRSRYIVEIQQINNKAPQKKQRILVHEPYPSRCVSGEEVIFNARLHEAKDFLTDTGRVFAYKRYLQQRGISAVSYIEESRCTGIRKEHAFFERIRAHVIKKMHTFLPAKEATLLGGLLLGLRGTLPAELMEAFRATGLIHIIVLSGHNITLIAEGVRRVLRKTPRSVSFLASLLAILVFVLLAGVQMAAVRAGSMAVIALIARATHREYDGIRALSLIVLAMAVYSPEQVLFSTSFHLSFLATLGLLLFAPSVEQKLKKIPEKYGIRGIIAATLATQIFLLPYLAYTIGEVSIIGIPANMVILPIIAPAMFFGTAVTLVALLSPTLATVLSPIALLPLKAITTLAETLAKIPHATILLPEIGVGMTVLLTAILTYVGYRQTRKTDEQREEDKN